MSNNHSCSFNCKERDNQEEQVLYGHQNFAYICSAKDVINVVCVRSRSYMCVSLNTVERILLFTWGISDHC